MFEVVYYSTGGNTKKVAEDIANKLGTKAKDIKSMDTIPENSLVLLGSGCYGSVNWLNTSSFLWIETGYGEEKSSSLPRLQLAGAKRS
jgi:flavodoxin